MAAGMQRHAPRSAIALDVIRTPANIEVDIATIGPAQFLQSLDKLREAGLPYQQVVGRIHQDADPAHAARLLCT